LGRHICSYLTAFLLLLSVVPASAQENTAAEADQLDKRVVELYQQGKYAEAVPLAQRAAEIHKRVLGEDHPGYATSLNNLALVYKAQGKYAEAEPLYKRSLAIREKVLGPDHPNVATSLNNLAGLYADQGKYAEAEPLYQRSLAIREKALGPDHPDVATSLSNLALLYKKQGEYAEAEPLYQRSLAIREKALGPDHPDVANSLNNLAVLYQTQGKYAEAEPLYQRSVAIREKALGPDHPALATSLNNLALLYMDRGRYAQAEPLYQRSLAIREKALGPDHPDVAAGLNNLALVYKAQGKYAEAEPLYKRALAIDERALGPEHPGLATHFNNLAALYEAQGKYAEAEPLYQRSLAIREKALGPDHPDVATSLNNLAALYEAQGKYAEAEPLYRRSLAIREKALGSDHPDVATSLNSLAALYEAQGKYGEAEPLYQRSLAIREKALGPDHPDVATSLNSLAALYEAQGKYGEAEPLYQRSLAIREKTLGPDHPDVANNLNNLAALYKEQGKYGEAEPLYQHSLAILEKALGPDHPDVANSLNNLALLYNEEDKFAQAEPLYHRSLAIWEKALGPDHPTVAASVNNLALLYFEQGKYAEAEPLYQRSLAILEKALGPDHPDVAYSLDGLALLYKVQGKYAEAEPLYRRSLAILEKALGPKHPDMVTILENLAVLNLDQGRYVEAETLYERALQNLSEQFENSFTYMSERDRLSFLGKVSGAFPLYFSLCTTYYPQMPALAGKAYDLLLWEKGMIASSMAAQRTRIAASGDAEALRLLDRLTEKKNQLAKLATALAESDPQKQAARRGQIEQLDNEAHELEKELAARSGALGEEKRLARVSWQQVREALKPEEAAVEVVRFPFNDGKKWTDRSYYVALVLRHDSRQPAYVVLGEAKDLEKTVLTQYRRGVVLARGFAVKEEANEARAEARSAFYNALWKPLQPALAGAHRIFIAPDGVLNQVALGAVSDGQGRLLIERYDLRTVNSTKDLLRGSQPTRTNTAALFGNPQFDFDEAQQRAAVAKLKAGEKKAQPVAAMAVTGQGMSRDLQGEQLKPLPGTQEEVRQVRALLEQRGWQAEAYTGEGALEEAVKRVRSPRVLHLATHGFFENDQERKLPERQGLGGEGRPAGLEDPMLRSGLYLAGANRALAHQPPVEGLENGVLTAYEATQLDLQGTELVVLSACETGLGEQRGGEGVFGLRRAFQEAGAGAVLMSMWSVPDHETQELMALFYGKWLGGMDKHEALRQAQLEERETVRKRYGKDLPYYWGAFVLVGR
jgi:tetratricopeptide (TPR) repeat protein